MKKLLLFITLIGLGFNTLAQNFAWAKSMGNPGSNNRGHGIVVDDSGNVYTTGYFHGTVDFDPGSGTFNLSSVATNASDIFVSKLNASGNFVWAKKMGGVFNERGLSIAVDTYGNVYTTGYFEGTTDFDPGPGTVNLTSAGDDIFISKLDASGNFMWAKKMGGSGDDWGYSITTDTSGNVYTTGVFKETADFDPGAGIFNLTSAGTNDIFILKLDASGNFIWAKSMGGLSQDISYSIATDASGNVYSTGFFQGTADFDPGVGVFNLGSAGGVDIFISKLDASGNFVWAKKIGGTLSDQGKSITLDTNGNVYITGSFEGTADFDPGAGTFNLTSAGGWDIFILKLDTSGNFMWAKNMGGTNHAIGFSITLDNSGNIYTTGYFRGTADFDPGAGTFNLTSVGISPMIFVSKLDTLGNFVWAKNMGGAGVADNGTSIAVDSSESVYTTGYFGQTADFDPGVGVYNLSSAGFDDIFISKLSCSSVTTDIQTACDSLTWIDGITYFSSTSSPTFTLTNTESCDSVITLNLTINSNSSTDVISACDSITWIDGNTYTTNTNTPIFTLTNAAGCDSVVTLNLTINNPNSGTDIVSACDSITWIDGNTYSTNTNTPIFTLTNAAGCDSVVTLNLTINNSNAGTDVQTACNNFTWIDNVTYTLSTNTPTFTIVGGAANGCDSIVTLDLTINTTQNGTDLQTACNSFTWIDNITYTSSTNTPTFTIVGGAANGCDSIVTLDLTITTIDNTTSLNTDTISANQNGATYQWLNCDSNNVVIAGATAQSFTPTATGNYAVELTVGSCVDTSACVNVIITGIEELTPTGMKVYPNPFDDNIVIEFANSTQNTQVTVVNIEGKVVYSNAAVNSNKLIIDAAAWSKGVYFVTVINDITSTTLKLIKE